MLETIKKAVFGSFNAEETKGVFLSAFSEDKTLLVSQGVLKTDMPLRDVITSVYQSSLEPILKDFSYVVCDVVLDIIEIKDMSEVMKIPTKEFGFAIVDIDDDRTGVLLPNTQGVADAKSVIFDIKQKYGIHGKAEIFVFRTQRTVITK